MLEGERGRRLPWRRREMKKTMHSFRGELWFQGEIILFPSMPKGEIVG